MLPDPIARAGLFTRLLYRLGLVRRSRYTDRLAVSESLQIRLDSALAAVDSQRERLAALREALDERADELTELRGELAAAEHERDTLRETLAPLPPVLFGERHAALLRDRGTSQRDLLDAISALISDCALSLSSQAVAPAVPADDRLHASGGAYHLTSLRMRLEHTVRARNEA